MTILNPSLQSEHDACEQTPTILVLDSGVGGLSVCRSILEISPGVRQVYVADDRFFPYGTMAEQALVERLVQLCSELIPIYQPELVVLACNTVSTLLLPELRARFTVPFVGVVPAIKPAAELSNTRHIGLLATPATISRPYTDQLIRDFASDCAVTRVGSRELVEEAEKLFRGEPLSTEIIERVVRPFAEQTELDTIVLGCTHFPFLRDALQQELPGKQWVDSGLAIARRVQHLLTESGHAASVPGMGDSKEAILRPVHRICFSDRLPGNHAFSDYLGKLGFRQLEMQLL